MFQKYFTHLYDISDSQGLLFLNDVLLGIPFLVAVYFYSKRHIRKKYAHSPVARYFIPALFIRLGGSLLSALVFDFYYDGGDTAAYFRLILMLRDVLETAPREYAHIILSGADEMGDYYLSQFFRYNFLYVLFYDKSTALLIKIGSVLGLLTFNTYIIISFLITIFSFIGCWKIYKVFQEMYPTLHKELAIAILFVPSVCFWGSGFMKEPLCIGALGIFFYSLNALIYKRRRILLHILLLVVMIKILTTVKIYILLCFAPVYVWWLFLRLRTFFSNKYFKYLFLPAMIVAGIVGSLYIFRHIQNMASQYALENIENTIKNTQNWLYYSSQQNNGSGYSLGNMEFTLREFPVIFAKAVNVALFRPYLWEARKLIIFPTAVESLITFFLTLYVLFKVRLSIIRTILTNADVQLCLMFSVSFAFAVGLVSYNFGALARYKTPLLPFYFTALVIIWHEWKKGQQPSGQ
jgi:hypothetical protein